MGDIAHVLSMKPMFGGTTPYFYSAAQHCILMHDYVRADRRVRAEALLYLAWMAYLPDFDPSLYESIQVSLPDGPSVSYPGLIARTQATIFRHFDLPTTPSREVEAANFSVSKNSLKQQLPDLDTYRLYMKYIDRAFDSRSTNAD